MEEPTICARGEGEMYEAVSVLERPPLDPTKTALVVVDMINWQVPRVPEERGGVDFTYFVRQLETTVIPNHQRLIAACRVAGARIVFLRVGAYQADYSDGVRPFQAVFAAAGARADTPACAVIDELTPEPGDVSLVKTGSGGFTTSGLDSHLRNMGVEHVLYSGIITNGCVLLTLTAGFDLGYYGYLVSDATTTYSEALQATTESLVSGWLADVVTTEQMMKTLGEA